MLVIIASSITSGANTTASSSIVNNKSKFTGYRVINHRFNKMKLKIEDSLLRCKRLRSLLLVLSSVHLRT